ncbi:MAG: glycosyltransferase family 9 protein, partial [Candidatus Paceibacterales bacterium]
MQNKILVVMPDRHFGNLVISLNAIKPLRDQYGAENVAVVFSDIHRAMITENIGLENIIFYPGKFNLRFIQQVRHFKPAISLALEGCSTSAWISYVSGAKRRVGLNNRKFSFLLTEAIPLRTNVHRRDSYLDIITKVDLAPNPPL